MQALVRKATAKTPAIDFNPESGILSLQGKSTPEDPRIFYKPLVEWCEEYAANAAAKTRMEIFLEYFDTSSSKGILDMIKRLKFIRDRNKEIEVIWYYESGDSDVLEVAECFKHITGLPFRMIAQ